MSPRAYVDPSRGWKARLADGIAGGFVGWCSAASLLKTLSPTANGSPKALLLLVICLAFFILGLSLARILSFLEKRRVPVRGAVLVVRAFSAGAVGTYAVREFAEGCSAGLSILAFGVFLAIALRFLDDTGDSVLIPSYSTSGRPSTGRSSPSEADQGASPRGLVAFGVRTGLRELFAMVASGVATGLAAGALRFGVEVQGAEPSCLLLFAVFLLGVATRLVCARWIQGKEAINTWKKKLFTMIDGLVVSVFLAFVAVSELPPAVRWDGTVSRNPLLWIVLGLVLGFLWGAVFGSVKVLLATTLRHLLDTRSVANIGASSSLAPRGPAPTPGRAEVEITSARGLRQDVMPSQFAGTGLSAEQDYPGKQVEPVPPPVRPRSACSCCLAIAALAASIVFSVMAYFGIWRIERYREDFDKLPAGCPTSCRDADLYRYKLAGVDFTGADLTGANLREAHLGNARLNGAILRNADLFRADFQGADLSAADLSGADLRRAILLRARFENTVMKGAYLQNATLQDLDLSTVDLEDADLRGAVYTQGTVWPPGFDPDASGARLSDSQ